MLEPSGTERQETHIELGDSRGKVPVRGGPAPRHGQPSSLLDARVSRGDLLKTAALSVVAGGVAEATSPGGGWLRSIFNRFASPEATKSTGNPVILVPEQIPGAEVVRTLTNASFSELVNPVTN